MALLPFYTRAPKTASPLVAKRSALGAPCTGRRHTPLLHRLAERPRGAHPRLPPLTRRRTARPFLLRRVLRSPPPHSTLHPALCAQRRSLARLLPHARRLPRASQPPPARRPATQTAAHTAQHALLAAQMISRDLAELSAASALQSLCIGYPSRALMPSKIIEAVWHDEEVAFRVMELRAEGGDMNINIYTRQQLPSFLLEQADTHEKTLRENIDPSGSKTGSWLSLLADVHAECSNAPDVERPASPHKPLHPPSLESAERPASPHKLHPPSLESEEEQAAAKLNLRPLPSHHTLGVGGTNLFLPFRVESRIVFFECRLEKSLRKHPDQQVLVLKFGDGEVRMPAPAHTVKALCTHTTTLHYPPHRLSRTRATHWTCTFPTRGASCPRWDRTGWPRSSATRRRRGCACATARLSLRAPPRTRPAATGRRRPAAPTSARGAATATLPLSIFSPFPLFPRSACSSAARHRTPLSRALAADPCPPVRHAV